MKVKEWTFFMTNQLILDLGSSKKLNSSQCDNYSSSYVAKKMGTYPQIIWKMAIFWKSYTGQWQTASLLVKVVSFLIVISTPYPVFATFCPFSCYNSSKMDISLVILAIFGSSIILKLTWTDIFLCSSFDIH